MAVRHRIGAQLPTEIFDRLSGPPPAARAEAPKLRRRPPKAIAQAANQAQPRARPPRTSVSQWTSRRTRLRATATAMPTAPPASAGQARRLHQRPATRAKAAQEAAAVEVWPLGKEGPRVAATASISGRARSTICLTASVRSL